MLFMGKLRNWACVRPCSTAMMVHNASFWPRRVAGDRLRPLAGRWQSSDRPPPTSKKRTAVKAFVCALDRLRSIIWSELKQLNGDLASFKVFNMLNYYNHSRLKTSIQMYWSNQTGDFHYLSWASFCLNRNTYHGRRLLPMTIKSW